MKGTNQTEHDTQISQELWSDINSSGFNKEIERVFKELRSKGYCSLVIRAAMQDELFCELASCTLRDGINHRKQLKEQALIKQDNTKGE